MELMKNAILEMSNPLILESKELIKLLNGRLEAHDDSRKDLQGKLHKFCLAMKNQISRLEEMVNKELEEKYVPEDNRLQSMVAALRSGVELSKTIQKAKAELLVTQSYELIGHTTGSENEPKKKVMKLNKKDMTVEFDLTSLCKLKTERRLAPEILKTRKPTKLRVIETRSREIALDFFYLNGYEKDLLHKYGFLDLISYKCYFYEKGKGNYKSEEYDMTFSDGSFMFIPRNIKPGVLYGVRMKAVFHGYGESELSDEVEIAPKGFRELCAWKECPEYVENGMKYSVGSNHKIAFLTGDDGCTIVGNLPIPLNKVTSWSILQSLALWDNIMYTHIGVVPFDVDQNETENQKTCGWYFNPWYGVLWSGPPHNYRRKKYGIGVELGSKLGLTLYNNSLRFMVGIVMDTTKGELSFVLYGVNLGVAYEGIPLDKPLVPCVLLDGFKNSYVELFVCDIKDKLDSSAPPLNVIVSKTGWNSITLTWNAIEGMAYYQIEVDGSKVWEISTANTFTKKPLLPDTEHTFRVRAVRGNSVSEWSDVVKARTEKTPVFPRWIWSGCPDGIDEDKKYSVDKASRVATKIGKRNCYSTIIEDTPFPRNRSTSLNVIIAHSKSNNGGAIYIGVAPFDIDQNIDHNYDSCGWYLNCYNSKLNSGPPHNYRGKEYGPRKGEGEYVHTGDVVGVVMDTAKGELSFVLNGVNHGVAYEGIPLDKPLVLCFLLYYPLDSVEMTFLQSLPF